VVPSDHTNDFAQDIVRGPCHNDWPGGKSGSPPSQESGRIRYEVFDETTYGGYDVEDPGGGEIVVNCGPGEATSMHIPDAVLDLKVAAVTGAVGAAGLLYAVRKLERHTGERTTVLMGTMAAFVFAAQMVNFPVWAGVSGHLLGGVLSAALLGPWAGAVVIAAVLIVQCFLFNDGGVTALGANFINMGLIGSVCGYAIYAAIRRVIAGPKGVLIAAMVAAWFSVLLASGAFAIELAASGRRDDFFQILSWMVLVHSLIGMGEALITGIVVRFVLLRRPDLLDVEDGLADGLAPAGRWGQTMIAGLAIALGVAVFLAPFASEFPDGLEYVGQHLKFLPDEEHAPSPPLPSPMADYELKLPGLDHAKVATAMAGVVGTLVVFGLSWGMARVLPQPKRKGATLDAA
jgi:cobalt/nickel transport system permease protein